MAYKETKSRARVIIRRAKRDAWEKLLQMFNVNTPIKQLWDIIRKFTKKERYFRPLPVLKIAGNMIDDPLEVANVFGQFFSDISSSQHYRNGFRDREKVMTEQMPSFVSNNEEVYNDLFTLDELNKSVSNCGNTSMGPDKIHYAFFRCLSEAQLQTIFDMINFMWRQGIIPDAWKHVLQSSTNIKTWET